MTFFQYFFQQKLSYLTHNDISEVWLNFVELFWSYAWNSEMDKLLLLIGWGIPILSQLFLKTNVFLCWQSTMTTKAPDTLQCIDCCLNSTKWIWNIMSICKVISPKLVSQIWAFWLVNSEISFITSQSKCSRKSVFRN